MVYIPPAVPVVIIVKSCFKFRSIRLFKNHCHGLWRTAVTWFALAIKTSLKTCLPQAHVSLLQIYNDVLKSSPYYLYHKCFAFHCTLTRLYLLRMRRNVTRIAYNARKNVNVKTTLMREDVCCRGYSQDGETVVYTWLATILPKREIWMFLKLHCITNLV